MNTTIERSMVCCQLRKVGRLPEVFGLVFQGPYQCLYSASQAALSSHQAVDLIPWTPNYKTLQTCKCCLCKIATPAVSVHHILQWQNNTNFSLSPTSSPLSCMRAKQCQKGDLPQYFLWKLYCIYLARWICSIARIETTRQSASLEREWYRQKPFRQ